MELIIYLVYLVASHSMLIMVVSIFAAIGSMTYAVNSARIARAGMVQSLSTNEPATVGVFRKVVISVFLLLFLLSAALFVFALINLIRPHLIDGMLIYDHGEKTTAKVLGREQTNNLHNEEPVDRYNVIYRTADGETVETYFESWDFNIYPSANSVRYPGPGQEFPIAYLPSFPKAFIILTDEPSSYSNSAMCADIMKEIAEKKNKYEFDPKSPKFVGEYMEALSKGIEKQCGKNLMDELRKIGERSSQ